MGNRASIARQSYAKSEEFGSDLVILHWAISNNGFRSDSFYEKKIGEDLVFNNALPKSLTIPQVACLKAKPKLHNGMVHRQFIIIPVVLIDATNYVYKCIAT